ncbi:MAG TPA: lyase family protein [Solirubrobacteraceae bacterium]|nr:lyase family protein [Solirubrobacteraceae bacterium]
MPSEPGLFDGIYSRGEAAAELSDHAWLQAMLDVEAALARANAAEGLIPSGAARAIVAACRAAGFDLEELERETARHATPVVGLVAALRATVPETARTHVHVGATSQDVVDTALMLIARRALEPLLGDLRRAADATARLAAAHRGTPMIGRTLLQQALPVTFGLRAAGWLVGLDEGRERLRHVTDHDLAVQMGGAVGGRAPVIAARMAADLKLAEPVLPWHAIRLRPVSLASALGAVAGVLGKIARDVTLLAQQEVGEAQEGGDPGEGGSSAIAHKHNPVAAVSVLACVKRSPGLVAGALACMEQEHERAAGDWQAEWGIHTELLRLTGSAAAWARKLLEQLQIDSERMRTNLAASPAAQAPLPDGAEELVERALAAHRAMSESEVER